MSLPTVTVRCSRCRRPLGRLSTDEGAQKFPPKGHDAWSDPTAVAWVEGCPKHGGMPAGLTTQQLDEERQERGLPKAEPGRRFISIPWRDLRAAYLESEYAQRVVDYLAAPRGRSV